MEEEKKKSSKKVTPKKKVSKTTGTKKVKETKKGENKIASEKKVLVKKEIKKPIIEKDEEKIEEKDYSVLKNKSTQVQESSFVEGFKNKYVIFYFLIGLVIGLLVMALIAPKKIATLKDGTQPILSINGENVTADDLYTNMKSKYAMSSIIDLIDKKILTLKYEKTDEMQTQLEQTADYYVSQYTSYYGYTEQEFFTSNGFQDRDAFIDYLALDYRRNLYYEEYMNSLVTDEKINTYYNDSVFGDINAKYIMIAATDDETDTDLANEIIKKLSKGSTYDSIIAEYGDKITSKDLGYVTFNDSTDSTIKTELVKLSNNSNSSSYVETTSGYAIIFRLDQKEKATLEDSKENIITAIKANIEANDTNISYKALINLRKENKLQFSDTELQTKYNDYCKSYE